MLDLSDIQVESHKIITCEIEGLVDEDDLRAMATGQAAPSAIAAAEGDSQPEALEVDDPTNMSKIREKWHNVARLVSKGMTHRLVASITGYDPNYLSVLLNNPAMQELVEMYRIQAGSAAEVITEKLRTVGGKALEKLAEKIDADGLNANELIQASKLGLDRSGHGPSSSTTHVAEVHHVDHAALMEQMRKARSGSREYIVPVHEVRDALRLTSPKDNEDEV